MNQGVGELVAAHGLGQFLYDTSVQGFFQNFEETIFGDVFYDRFQLVQRELPANYRSHGEGLVATLGQPV